MKLRLRLESDTRLEPPLLQCMGRSNSQKAWGYLGDSERAQRKEYLSGHAWWKRARPTRHQATAPTLKNFVKPPGYGSSRGDLAPSLSYEVLAKAKQIYREDYLLYERL